MRPARFSLRGLAANIVLVAAAGLFLIPFLWMLSSALKPNYQIFSVPPQWMPNPPRWENFSEALTILPFGRYTLNTLVITVLTTLGHVLSCSVVAYGFARLRARFRDALFVVVLATMMLPYPATMVPLYILFKNLGLGEQHSAAGGAGVLRQRVLHLSPAAVLSRLCRSTIEEAARIDGANVLQIIFQIILPLSFPCPGHGGNLHFSSRME